MNRPGGQGWKALLGVVLGATLALFVIDYAFWIAYPPHPLRQVDDALAELDDVSPDVLATVARFTCSVASSNVARLATCAWFPCRWKVDTCVR
jgi:hypothetical protein